MNYALFYNIDSDDVELYPKLENHNLSQKDIEKYLEDLPFARKWTLYDHLPTEDDIDEFEKIIDDEEDEEEEEN